MHDKYTPLEWALGIFFVVLLFLVALALLGFTAMVLANAVLTWKVALGA